MGLIDYFIPIGLLGLLAMVLIGIACISIIKKDIRGERLKRRKFADELELDDAAQDRILGKDRQYHNGLDDLECDAESYEFARKEERRHS